MHQKHFIQENNLKLNQFLATIADTLEYEGTIGIDDRVLDIEGWDSLGILAIVSMLDGLGMSVKLEELKSIETISDFVVLVGFVDE